MQMRNQKGLLGGVMFFGVGVSFAAGGMQYSVGTAARLALLMAALVLIIIVALPSIKSKRAQAFQQK